MSASRGFREIAAALLEEARCSVELPAGTGKTELIANVAAMAADLNRNCLILTHTNAGVAALDSRCRRMSVPAKHRAVSTICSWGERVSVSYRVTSGISKDRGRRESGYFNDCVHGASLVMNLCAMRTALSSSYSVLLVDEYQDCNLLQHRLIEQLSVDIPCTIVFGDRLQRIFDFPGEVFPDWSGDVLQVFPPFKGIEPHPHRWDKTNPALGEWLLHDVRPALLANNKGLSFLDSCLNGYRHLRISDRYRDLPQIAGEVAGYPGSSLVICPNLPVYRMEKLSKQLSFRYTQMEDIEGRFMQEQIEEFCKQDDSSRRAVWLLGFSKRCFTGLSNVLDRSVASAMENGSPISKYSHSKARERFAAVLSAFEETCTSFNTVSISHVNSALRESPARLSRREAWEDTLEALRVFCNEGTDPLAALERLRDQRRRFSQRIEGNQVSKTLLVKGLEYDNVLIVDTKESIQGKAAYSAENLYVALTRPTTNLVVLD